MLRAHALLMQQLFLQESLMVLIGATRRRIKQVAWDRLKPHGVTPQQAGVIVVLGTEGSVPLSELAARLWCDTPTACRIVNKLVERGLIHSSADPSDRRRYVLELTPPGQNLARELVALSNQFAEAVQAGFSRSELATLRRLLGQVCDNMARLSGAETQTQTHGRRSRVKAAVSRSASTSRK